MTSTQNSDKESFKSDPFHTTQWSVVAAARGADSQSRGALAALCESYWRPIYAYVRRRAPNVEDAQDLTQEFFAELLDKDVIGAADADRGRFRCFLLTACRNFLSRQREKANAKKRGGGQSPLSLDFQAADSNWSIDPAAGLTPDQIYEQQWVYSLLDNITERLRLEMAAAGKAEQFDALKPFLIGHYGEASYAEAAARLELNEPAARKAASRLRARFGQLLRDEIARTVCDAEEVDDEIQKLFAILDL